MTKLLVEPGVLSPVRCAVNDTILSNKNTNKILLEEIEKLDHLNENLGGWPGQFDISSLKKVLEQTHEHHNNDVAIMSGLSESVCPNRYETFQTKFI